MNNHRTPRIGHRHLNLALIAFLIGVPSLCAVADDPRITLIVLGDPVFAGALERELETRLQDAGFDVADGRGALQPTDATLSLAEIVSRLETAGDLLVAVEIERLGERELRYLGREEWLFSARLDLQAFLLPTGRALGGWDEEVEYTETMVSAKVERCFADLMPELSQTLRTAWDDYRADRIAAAAATAAAKTASEAGSGQPRQTRKPAVVADPLQAYESGDYPRAAELWGAACTGGETIACYNLGLIYLDGAAGVGQDQRRAAELFQRACDGGEAAGCFNLGAMYAEGDGIPRDAHKSAALFRQACNGGAEAACFNLGLLYFTGDSVLPRDPRRAGELFQQACDGDYAPGCFNLGTFYANGEAGFPRDENRAAVLFQQACDGGEGLGCSNLELLCERNPAACEPLEPR